MKATLKKAGVCGFIGSIYGGIIGLLVGLAVVLYASITDHFFQSFGALGIITSYGMAAVLGFCPGAIGGFIAGLVAGIIGRPWGWSLGSLLSGFFLLDTIHLRLDGPSPRPFDSLRGDSLILFVSFLVFLAVSGLLLGYAVHRGKARIPFRRVASPENAVILPRSPWPVRAFLILILALPILAFANRYPSDYLSDAGEYPTYATAESGSLLQLNAMMARFPQATSYTVEWSVEWSSENNTSPFHDYLPRAITYHPGEKSLKSYPQDDPTSPDWTLSDVAPSDIQTIARMVGSFDDIKRRVGQKTHPPHVR